MAVFFRGLLQISLRALLPLVLLAAILSHQRPTGFHSLRGGHIRSSGPALDERHTRGAAPRRTADGVSEAEPRAGCSCEPASQDPQSVPLPLFVTLPIIIALVLLSGLFSGLTLGLLSLDVIGLQTVQKGDNQELAQCAEKIYPVRKAGNQLLCTLLLGNVAVNSAISILTADIADGLIGFLVSTALILLFGEIFPQAACSRYALQVGARAVPIVKFLLVLFYVVAKPLSVALDYMLGKEVGTIYSPSELMEMLKLQISLGACGEVEGKMAKQVAEGALCFRDKCVEEVMTPVEDVYMLPAGCCLGYERIREIFETGFSRIPVYGCDKHDYVGILYTKDLMLADPEDEMRLGDFIQIFSRRSETFFKDTKLVNVLNAFKKGGTHIGLIREVNTDSDINPKVEVRGIVTLEDIVEEILQEEIVDETDVYVDVDHHVRVGDGREDRIPPLGLFNPAWRRHRERPSREETKAVAAHLQRTVFVEGSKLELSIRAVEWLVNAAGLRTRARVTPQSCEEPEEKGLVAHIGRDH